MSNHSGPSPVPSRPHTPASAHTHPHAQPGTPAHPYGQPPAYGQPQPHAQPHTSYPPNRYAPNPYAAQSGHVPPGPPPATGAMAWWLGLLTALGVPPFSSAFGIIATVICHVTSHTRPVQAQENARRSLNWQLSVLLYSILLFAAHFVLLFTLGRSGRHDDTFFPIGIALTVLGVLWVYHLVGSVIVAIMANGRAVSMPGTIPFVRRRRAPGTALH